MIIIDNLNEIFCIVDEFCKEFERVTDHFLLGN